MPSSDGPGPGLDMDAATSEPDRTPSGSPDTGEASAPDMRAGNSPDTRSPDTRPAPDAFTQQGDTNPAIEYCQMGNDTHYSGCGFLQTDYTWRSQWKDGYACGVCTLAGAQRIGCLVAGRPETQIEGSGPVLCVRICGDCCWRRAGSSCQGDADCCSQLRCSAGSCQ